MRDRLTPTDLTYDDWKHLHRYGYAPGEYSATCGVCGEVQHGLDKRAVCCRPCAEWQWEAAQRREVG